MGNTAAAASWWPRRWIVVANGLGEREREKLGLGLSCFCFMVAGAPTSWWSAWPAVVDGGSSWLWWWVGGVGEIEREREVRDLGVKVKGETLK